MSAAGLRVIQGQAATNPQARKPRANHALERQVLGAALLDASAFEVLESHLSAADFDHPAHAAVFAAMQAVIADKQPLDPATVTAALAQQQTLAITGEQLPGDLMHGVSTAENVEAHAKLLADLSWTRRIASVAKEIYADACNPAIAPGELTGRATAVLFKATERKSNGGPVAMSEIVSAALDASEARRTAGEPPGLKTGFPALDAVMAGGGFCPGRLYVLGAPPSTGKSAFAMNVGYHVARKGHSVLMQSMEMQRQEIGDRLLCSVASVDSRAYELGHVDEGDLEALTIAAETTTGLPFYVDDSSPLTLGEIRAKAIRHKRLHGLRLLIVDFLQEMNIPGADSEEHRVKEAAKGLKALAKELDIPILALASLNRDAIKRVGDKRPILSDLRGSGWVESCADLIAFLYRDELVNPNPSPQDKGIAEVIFRKQRQGPFPLTVRLRFQQKYTRFEPEHADVAE